MAGGNPTLYGYVEDTNIWIDIFGLDCTKKTSDKGGSRRDAPRTGHVEGTHGHCNF
jgi:hypothetical protein